MNRCKARNAAAVGSMWPGLGVLGQVRDHEVSIEILEEIDVAVPEASRAPGLALTLNGEPIDGAVLVRIKVMNSGRQRLEPEEKGGHWLLTLLPQSDGDIRMFGELERFPKLLPVGVHVDSERGTLELRAGSMNPGAFFEGNLVVTGTRNVEELPIDANVDDLKEVNSALVGRVGLEGRVRTRLLIVLGWIISGLMFVVILVSAYRAEQFPEGVLESIQMIMAAAIFSAFGGFFLGFALATLLTRATYSNR